MSSEHKPVSVLLIFLLTNGAAPCKNFADPELTDAFLGGPCAPIVAGMRAVL